MEEITYHLNDFDGPLDLLLTLISKNKIDIHDIPIVSIFDQYMAFLDEAKQMDLEIATDFILMASQLMLIKSRMLLPGRPDQEDPRKELVNQLELYIAAKNAAEQLKPLYAQYAGRMAKETDEIPPEKGAPLGLNPALLTQALQAMIRRINAIQPEPNRMITPLIATPMVSVEEKIREMIDVLEKRREPASLFFLLKDVTDKPELVARFMGILELIKIRRILICEDSAPEDVTEDDTFDYTSGVWTAFRLNPDYDPAEAEAYRSEFESDEPEQQEDESPDQGESEEGQDPSDNEEKTGELTDAI